MEVRRVARQIQKTKRNEERGRDREKVRVIERADTVSLLRRVLRCFPADATVSESSLIDRVWRGCATGGAQLAAHPMDPGGIIGSIRRAAFEDRP